MTITTGSFPKELSGGRKMKKKNKKYPVSKMNRAKAKRFSKVKPKKTKSYSYKKKKK